ncbi:MAG: phage tail protein [Synergistaceae bacterium]|nr:phage tail protein [Synergistaceae bacterium]
MGVIATFPGNPRQKHQFILRVRGMDSAWFEKATLPEVEIEIDEFGPAGSVRNTKFAGRAKIGDCTLEKGMKADGADMDAWRWLTSATNTATGELGDPAQYREDVEICHVDRVGNPIQTWRLKEAFCSKISWGENEGTSSDHVIETLTLTVGDVEIV